MIFLDSALRYTGILLIAARIAYWMYEEYQTQQSRPTIYKTSIRALLMRLMTSAFNVFLIFQLLGLQILPYDNLLSSRLLGICMIILSTILFYLARIELGANWSHASDYQIKKKHTLVTSGLYAYIRHPIYLAFLLSGLGVQFIVGSYLLLLLSIVLPWILYWQAKAEEKILAAHFGDAYTEYRKKTFLFLPFIL